MDFTLINKAVNICAKRNSGKSELVKYLVKQEMNAFDKIFVFSSTEPMNKFYQKYIPKNNIFSEFSEQWLERLYKRMTELKDQDKNYNVLIIFDDVNDDLHESKMIKKLYSTGRHLNLACIVICQYVNQLPPICRTNCDYMLIGQTNAYSIELLSNEYLFGPITKKEFIKMYHDSTKDYNFLIINCNSVKDNNDLNQLYGTIKAII